MRSNLRQLLASPCFGSNTVKFSIWNQVRYASGKKGKGNKGADKGAKGGVDCDDGDKKQKEQKEQKEAPKGAGPKMVLVQPEDERCFILDVLEKIGVPKEQSEMMVDNLVYADSRGILTHGLARFPMYVKEVQQGTTCANAMPTVLHQTAATAWVDGNNTFGSVVGTVSMCIAIKKAKECGIGWVSAKGSNHFGVNSFYTSMAAKQKLIGIAGTNSTPLMVPPGGKASVLGTNPLSIAAGTQEGYRFCLDSSMTKVARGKIETNKVKGIKIPKDWALDKDGNPTEDPEKALAANLLLPSGEHKGFGLGAMIDIMGGVLSGANHSSKIASWNDTSFKEDYNLGQIYIAINPGMFVKDFEERLRDFLDSVRKTEPLDPKFPVLVPGDIETYYEQVLSKDGYPFPENLMTIVNNMAKQVGAAPLKFKPKDEQKK